MQGKARRNIPWLISIVSESIPHLKRGAIRDFENILGDQFQESKYNKTDSIYRLEKSMLEFFSADKSSKLRGGRRNDLYINEANNIAKKSFDEADVRTSNKTIVDFNPVGEFWVHDEYLLPDTSHKGGYRPKYDYVAFIHSTYLDAKEVLPSEIVESIESRKDKDPNWWRVYGLGEVGNISGLVHPLFSTIDNLPGSGAVFYGLDFGFSNDPAALVKCVIQGDRLLSHQLLYEKGLSNAAIAKRMVQLGVRKHYDEIFADSAEPKSIKEIKDYGFNIKPAPKGPDSIRMGIQKLNQYHQFWTKSSIEAIKEQRNYRYIEDSEGRLTQKPIDDFNHLMDARRYALIGKLNKSVVKSGRIAI